MPNTKKSLRASRYAARVVALLVLAGCWGASISRAAINDLAAGFVQPPGAARMWTWWFWLDDRVDKASITADLEALKAQGIAGVTVYSLSAKDNTAQVGPAYMGPEWRELFKHTLKEAERLGLGVSTMLCSGWSAGGPWIKPEQACKEYTRSVLTLTGPQHFRGALPQPLSPPRFRSLAPAQTPAIFTRDVAVQAFRVDANQPLTNDPAWSMLLEYKSGRATFDEKNWPRARIAEMCAAPLKPLPPEEPGTALDPASIIDLTTNCHDGVLDWDMPKGQWVVLRTGFAMSGNPIRTSSPSGAGLEADPLDATAMDVQFANVVAPLAQDAGPLTGKVFKSVQIDSWEIYPAPNWTINFMDEFKARRGYDPHPYLPTLTGFTVANAEITDRFLYDYRQTLGDCVAENYFGRLNELAEAQGLVQQSEAGGPTPMTLMTMDCLKNLGRCAIPMGEFWQDGTWLEGNQNKNGKQTASAAHLYGKPIVAAEAFSSMLHWLDSPASLKPTADRAFCEGFNHFFIFSSATHSGDGTPGTEYFAGTYFNRKITWWNEARCFADYIARCSYLLQQGLFVADVLFYNGDGCPNFVAPKHVEPSLGPGFDYDVCNSEIILTRLAAQDGRIVLPDGLSYRLLVLPDRTTMPVAVARKLKQLVAAGITLVGPKPEKDPGLNNYPRCDAEVQAIANELWGPCDGKTVTEHAFGKGRVIWGVPLRQILSKDGVPPDCAIGGGQPDTFIDWIHRRADGAEIYFLANRTDHAETVTGQFRVGGRQPDIWDPATGTLRAATTFTQQDGIMTVPLKFAPYESLFIIFRHEPAANVASHAADNFPTLSPVQNISGPWTIAFDPRWGGPEAVQFDHLTDWILRPEEGIQHYSGTATYRKTFDLADGPRRNGARLFLNLGVVKELARVRLNGQDLGVVWTAPWQVEITDAVKEKGNELELAVINLWPNRLMGDAKLPPEKRFTQTNIQTLRKPRGSTKLKPIGEQPLLSSGLLGPVTIQASE